MRFSDPTRRSEPSQIQRLKREGNAAKKQRINEENYPDFYRDVYGNTEKKEIEIISMGNMDKFNSGIERI